MPKVLKIDRPFLIIVISLVVVGFFIFLSASLGLTAKGGAKFSSIVWNQILVGLVMGGIFSFILSKIKYTHWRKYSFYFFIASALLTAAVFIPGLGSEHGGATRWLQFGPISFQPSELLKIAYILYFAAWLSGVKKHVKSFKYGLLPLILVSSVAGLILLKQPDTSTFIVMVTAAISMFTVAGGKWKHLLIIGLIGVVGLAGLMVTRPYIKDRILTFIDPSADSLTSGYQIQQSLIAIGSGGINGRGFGQSIQKFNFLPEPIGDSIFAVAAEEFGFIGAFIIVALFVAFALRGFKIALRVKDNFGALFMVGIVMLVTIQAFTNIGAMLGVIPLSGLPLLFISHGGTAMFITLATMGVLFNISKYQSKV